MNSSNDITKLVKLDGLNMYDRFEVIRRIVRQAVDSGEASVIRSCYAEIMLNMMMLKISLYLYTYCDPLHVYEDYSGFMAFMKDALEYMRDLYSEDSGGIRLNDNDIVDLIDGHYESYIDQHREE